MTVQQLLTSVESKLASVQSLLTPQAIAAAESALIHENRGLRQKVESLKDLVRKMELDLGTTVPMNSPAPSDLTSLAPVKSTEKAPTQPQTGKKERKAGDKPASSTAEAPVDVGRLDMRVGRIVEVSRHPDADSLYVEKVDLGEGKLRTVVSGLVKYVPLESLQDRVGIFMCNLKPAKMRGVESEAMLMCSSAPEQNSVEPLLVESDSIQLGDPVVVSGYPYNPDAQLNPKKKIFEQVKPDLRVDTDGFAAYRGVRWALQSNASAVIKAANLKDVQIA